MLNRSFVAGVIVGVAVVGAATVVIAATPWAHGDGQGFGVATSADGATVYVVTQRAMYRSRDGGETWVELPVK